MSASRSSRVSLPRTTRRRRWLFPRPSVSCACSPAASTAPSAVSATRSAGSTRTLSRGAYLRDIRDSAPADGSGWKMLTAVLQARGEAQGQGCCLLRAQEAGRETAHRGEEDGEGRHEDDGGPPGLRLLEIVANSHTSLSFMRFHSRLARWFRASTSFAWMVGIGNGYLTHCASQAWDLINT